MESLSMVSHTNALIKNRETIDINLYEQFIKYLDASPKTVETYKKSLKQMFSYLLSNNVTSPRCEDLLAYRNYLFAKGLKPTTIQNYITAAKIFFTWTNEEGYYPNICNSEKGMSYTQYYNRFKNLTCALGMDHSPHETRHTFATLAKEAKVDEYCLKLILGHNIADLTERVYTHRKKEQLLEEIKKIE